jgi:hypothetical protein
MYPNNLYLCIKVAEALAKGTTVEAIQKQEAAPVVQGSVVKVGNDWVKLCQMPLRCFHHSCDWTKRGPFGLIFG